MLQGGPFSSTLNLQTYFNISVQIHHTMENWQWMEQSIDAYHNMMNLKNMIQSTDLKKQDTKDHILWDSFYKRELTSAKMVE